MTDFIKFRDAVNAQIKKMETSDTGLLKSSIDKKLVWDTYLSAFPEGSNPVYLTNTTHDCNCCKDFVRDLGRAVSIDDDNNIVTCWDISIDDDVYQTVANALAKVVREHHIESTYKSSSMTLHIEKNTANKEQLDRLVTYDHFYYNLSSRYNEVNRAAVMGTSKGNFKILKRALTELKLEAVDSVLDLIADNNLYLGEQNQPVVSKFRDVLIQFQKVDDDKKDNFIWKMTTQLHASVMTIKNAVIGTLIEDISTSNDVENSVKSYEHKVAPHNYKRSKSIVTEKMIKSAQEKIKELGMSDSLQRRHATLNDITINNIIWADEETTHALKGDVFDDMMRETSVKKRKDGIKIGLLEFVDSVIPSAKSIEIYLENKHANNFVTLVAPVHKDAPNMMNWDNNFSWSYKGNVTDSIKERVKSKGGNVTGDLRVSLSWFNIDDLDLHMETPKGKVYFRRPTLGDYRLDVDMNINEHNAVENAVENISVQNVNDMCEGEHTVYVNNFTYRKDEKTGFDIELEFMGETHVFSSPRNPNNGQTTKCFSFNYSKKHGLTITNSQINTTSSSGSEIWNVQTKQYHNVSSVMWSPNHWDDNKSGNRHVFFMLKDAKNPEPVRGFYNEYLIDELQKDRKVFEVLAGKMKAEPSESQLSGIGFSTTKQSEFTATVKTDSGEKTYTVTV